MTELETMVWVRIERACGEAQAVGEIEICRMLWPLDVAEACAESGGVRSPHMQALRRAVRKIVEGLRLDFNKPILDSPKGYFLAATAEEEDAFCHRRHTRGITSLVVERIVRKQSVAEVGVQQLFEFIAAEERRRRRIFAKTTGLPADAYSSRAGETVIATFKELLSKLDAKMRDEVRELVNAGGQ